MVGRTYRDLRSLRRAAERLADPRGYPTVEYHDGRHLYRYDGSPALPDRPVRVVQDLGPYCSERGGFPARARIA
ncbi:MAG TPA: hypothetical protein VK001_04650 [Geminicoccaceae bacterium]|nr:hypothetical protein [Geminicoccaceae bacterium]